MSLCWKCKYGLYTLGVPPEEIRQADKESSKRRTKYCSSCGRPLGTGKGEWGHEYYKLEGVDTED